MALILGIQFLHMSPIMSDESDSRDASDCSFWNLAIEICLGFGDWDLGFLRWDFARRIR
jgi:hypothetical protein